MTDFRLHVFYISAQKLNFTETAKELHISQPAVSKHIKELEESLGVRLFDRNRNGLALTADGATFLNYAEKLLSIYNELSFELGTKKRQLNGSLKIGASTTIAQYILPPVLAKFISKFPNVNPVLLNGNSKEIEAAIFSKKIDIGMIEGTRNHKQLKYIPFIKDELVAVVSAKNKIFSHKEKLSIKELKSTPVVLRERGSGTLAIIEKALGKKRIKLSDLKILLHLGSTESIKLFLQHNDCIGFLSIQSISSELAEGKFRVIEIPGLNLDRQLYFVHKHGSPGGLSSAFIRFASGYYK